VSQFKVSFVAAAAAAFLAACGGGGGSVTAVAPPLADTSGVAVDGYLSGSTVVCDANANGRADAGEATTTTNATGGFIFTPGCASPMVITGGINIDTGFAFVGQLKAPAGSTVVTPLTTLMVVGNMTAAQLAAALGLPAGTDVTRIDPANGQNPELFKKTLAVQQVLQQIGKFFGTDNANAMYVTAATELANALKATNAAKLVGDDGSINLAVLQTVVSNVATATNSTLLPAALAGLADQLASQAERFLASNGSLDDLARVARLVQAPTVVIDASAGNKYVALGNSGVSLNGQPISLAQFAGNGVSVTDFRELGIRFDVVGAPSVKVTTSVAVDFKEDVANNPRRLQIMIDKVNVEYDANANTWQIAAANDAKVHVYGRKGDGSEINASYNDLSFAPYTVNNNQVTLQYRKILDKVFASAASSDLKSTAESFMNIKGSFITTVAVSRLNMRKSDGSALDLQDVQMEGGAGRVTGVGIQGKVTFN
jgi:hypothetical protein